MSTPLFPAKLSALLKDQSKTFWKGDGTLSVEFEELLKPIIDNPAITVAGLQAIADKGVLKVGLSVAADPGNVLKLGQSGSSDNGLKLGLSAAIDGWLYLILNDRGYAEVDPDTFEDLGALLRRHTVLEGNQGLVVLTFSGEAGADLSSELLNRGGATIGVSFKASGNYAWFGCSPAPSEMVAVDAIRSGFDAARLPQTKVSSADQLRFAPNEVLFSRLVGSIALGANASFGYDVSATTGYSVGDLDLSTRFTLEASARLGLGYQIGGGFLITARRGSAANRVRVIVEKDKSSVFDFSFGVAVGVELKTSGLPSDDVALGLVESIVGVSTPQIIQDIRELAALDAEAIKDKASGFVKGLAREWVAAGLGQITEEAFFQAAFAKFVELRDAIAGIDDRVLELYERFRAVTGLDDILDSLESILAEVDPSKKKTELLKLVSTSLGNAVTEDDKKAIAARDLIERLLDKPLGTIASRLDEVHEELEAKLAQLRKLLTPNVKGLIDGFLDQKLATLRLQGLFDKLGAINSIDDLEDEVLELFERLIDKPLEEILNTPALGKALDEVRDTAKKFEDILDKIDAKILQAANAKGRFDLAVAYQRAASNSALLDVEIELRDGELTEAREAYHAAVTGDFATLFEKYEPLLEVHQAAFTDIVKSRLTIDTHIFGLDFKHVRTLLSQWEWSIEHSPTGLVTVYNFSAEATRRDESGRRAVKLGFMLGLVGTVKGGLATKEQLTEQIDDPMAMLRRVDNTLDYRITDRFASFVELREYFRIGHEQLRIISEDDYDNLVQAAAQLETMRDHDKPTEVANVELAYTVRFDGEALAKALATDFTGHKVPYWEGGRSKNREADSNVEALKRMYVDRLVACRVAPVAGSDMKTFIPYMFARGIYDKMVSNSTGYVISATNTRTRSWTQFRIRDRQGNMRPLKAPVSRFRYCARHYNVANGLAEFLDQFRQALSGGGVMTRGQFANHLTEMVALLSKISAGSTKALPFMLLDEMVRRTAEEPATARDAMLELTFKDEDNNVRQYLPISG